MKLHTQLAPSPPPRADDDLVHTVCCRPERALCGVDMRDAQLVCMWNPADLCVVCEDLFGQPCGDACTLDERA